MKDSDLLALGVVLAGAAAGWAAAKPGGILSSAQPAKILDRRAHARLSKRARPHTRKRGPHEKVDAVVLHQMGFSRGNDPSRYDSVTAHYKILPNGTIVQSHDHSVRLPAANGFNSRSVSVEFVGNLPKRSRSTLPSDFYKPEKFGMNQLTSAAIKSGQALMRYLYARGLRFVFAHSQSAGDRGIDPGPDIWFNVGEYAKRIGMNDGGPGYRIGDGSPIPEHWRTLR